MFVFVSVLVVLVCHGANADTHSLGKCPHVNPEYNFHMEKMLGTWYAIQKTATSIPCLVYNITEKEGHPGHYLLIESFPSSKLSKMVGLGHEHHVTGELCALDEAEPAIMDLKVPLDIGTYKFTVMMTDYANYAAVFSCKTYPYTFSRLIKWSAMILSRTPTLDIEFVEKIRTRFSAYNIDPFTLSIIDHHHCTHDEKGIVIQAASNAIDKVSKKIGEAVNSAKNFVGNEKATITENNNAFSAAVDEVNGGNLNTLFENPDLNEALEGSAKADETHHDQQKPSYSGQ